MRTTRTARERLVDAILSLVALNHCVSADGMVGDRLKAAKLLFLLSHGLFAKQVKAFSFSFYKWAYGPFTTELYDTWGELNWMGYLELEPGSKGRLRLTGDGIAAADRCADALIKLGNESILVEFKRVSDSFAPLSTAELLRHVYRMSVIPVGWQRTITIGDVPAGAYLTCTLEDNEAYSVAVVDDALLGSFLKDAPWAQRPQQVTDALYAELYASASRGVRAERAGQPGKTVSVDELRRKAQSS